MKKALMKRCVSAAIIAGLVLTTPQAMVSAASDVEKSWAKETINTWISEGLITGYEDGTFRPDDDISRAEFITLVNKSLKLEKTAAADFKDVKSSDWYYKDLTVAVGNGYITGYADGSFGANDRVTRGQAAVMLQKVKGLDGASVSSSFTDGAAIPKWAASAVNAAVAKGYFKGYPDGSFGADNPLTRAEAVAVLDKARKDTISATTTGEDVTVDKAGTVIKNQTITGNLIISEKVGSGSVTVESTTVKGDVLVQGGGSNSIHLKDSNVGGKVQMNYQNTRLVMEGNTKVENVLFQKSGKLDADKFNGSIGTVEVDKGIDKASTVQINAPAKTVAVNGNTALKLGADVQKVIVDKQAAGAKLDIASTAKVTTLQANAQVSITGKGTISTLEANANGITSEIKAGKTETASDVTKPSVTPPSGGNSGGGGGGSSSGGGSGAQTELKIEDFVLIDGHTLKVKLNTTSSNIKFSLKGIYGSSDPYITGSQLETNGYYYVYASYEYDGMILLQGNYQLVVSGTGYTTATYNFKGSDMLDSFLTTPEYVTSVNTESGRNQLEIKIAGSMNTSSSTGNIEGITFTVMEDGVNILRNATVKPFESIYTVYTLDLNKEITGGKTYTITLEKEGFRSHTMDYVPVSSITIENKDQIKPIACGEGVSDMLSIDVSVNPANATHKTYTCEIGDEEIVHLSTNTSSTGYILENGVKEGTTTLKILSPDGVSDQVTIQAKKMSVTDVYTLRPACLVRLNGTNNTTAWVSPNTAFDKNLTWSIADETIATLEDNEDIGGNKAIRINGVKLGLTTMTVTAADGGGASADVKIFVYEDSLAFVNSSVQNNTITKDASGQQIRLNMTPEDSFTTVNPTANQIKLESFNWSTSTPDLIEVEGMRQSRTCTITPKGITGTAKLKCQYTTQYGDYLMAEMEIIITD